MPNRTNNDHYIIIYSLPSASHLICTVYPRGGGGGVLGYKHDGGCLTEPNILHPKKNTRLPAMKVIVFAKIPMIRPMRSLCNR